MKQLFFSECSKYKKLTAIFFICMLMLFAYLTSDSSPWAPDTKYGFIYFFPIILAIAFGLVQMYLHKRANHWSYLIHRPLDTRKIFLAVIGAGMTIIFIVTALPFLLVTVYLDALTYQSIDLRDYSNIVASLLRYYVFYLASCLVILNASKGTAVMYLTLFLLLCGFITPASQLAVFLPSCIFFLGLLYLNAISFKPDVTSFSNRPMGIVIHSASMMLGIFMLMMFTTATLHELGGTIMSGKAGPSTSKGTMRYFGLLTKPEDRLAYALEDSEHSKVNHYINQAKIADTDVLKINHFQFLFRGQTIRFESDPGTSFKHPATNTIWNFSHDSMLFEGRNLTTKESAGFVGKRGFKTINESIAEQDRFSEVPLLIESRYLMTPEALYYVDFEDRIFETKYQLQDGERYVHSPAEHSSFFTLLTNQRLLLFDKQDFASKSKDITPEYSVALPVRYQNFNEIRFYELVDGYLLQFMGMNFYDYEQPGVEVHHAKLNGEVEQIESRRFTEFYVPAWRRHLGGILAPAVSYAFGSVHSWVTADPKLSLELQSLSVTWRMLILHIASFIAVVIMCREHHLNRALTVTWLGLTGVFGLPALVCFFLLNPWIPLRKLFGSKLTNSHQDTIRHEPLSS